MSASRNSSVIYTIQIEYETSISAQLNYGIYVLFISNYVFAPRIEIKYSVFLDIIEKEKY